MLAVASEQIDKLNGTQAQSASPQDARVPTASELYLSALIPDDEKQAALERNFFSSIRLKNGTYKYTYPHRLDDLNDLVSRFLPADRPLKIMDVAVSSGISTLEWMSHLAQAGVEHHMTAGDLTVKAFLVSIGKHLRVLLDSTGYPLQFDVRGKAIPNPPGKRNLARYFLPLLLLRAALRVYFPALKESASRIEDEQSVSRLGINCRALTLVSPRLARPSNLTIIEDDILGNACLRNAFHILRAANILNRCYFDDKTLIEILNRLRSRLMPAGLFVVCRTNERGENHGTVFALNEDGRFEVRARIGDGSEVEDLVLGLLPLKLKSSAEISS